ncbi:MAG: hypothetical protein LBK83_07655 [Treponema sp.]|jgi:hypothetical protein|nr:hypothetical protein [Treponema sp.]
MKKAIEAERLEQLKKAHPGGLYEGSIEFNDEDDKLYTVEFIYRRPTMADVESHAKAAQRNPIVANLNIITSLIVHPESGAVIGEIREYPAACARFVDEAVNPFFGANVSVRSRKL